MIISTQVLGDVFNCMRGDWLRGGTGVVIAGALLLFLLEAKSSSYRLSRISFEEIQRGYNLAALPLWQFQDWQRSKHLGLPMPNPSLCPVPERSKFAHQEIGIKQEDDKSHLDHRSPDTFLHGY